MSSQTETNERLFKVGKNTKTKSLALGIYAEVTKQSKLTVTFVGSQAGFIATKALAVVNDKLKQDGKELWAKPQFEMARNIEQSDSDTVALTFCLKAE